VWRATAFLPLLPILMCLLWLDVALTEGREGFDLSLILTLTAGIVILPGIFTVRQYLASTEAWAAHNVSRTDLIAALERALQSRGIPFDWHVNRLRLPTIGAGGSALTISRWFGSAGIEVAAADRNERRVVAETVLPLLRDELSNLPRPIVPASGVFFLAWGVLMLFAGTQLPRLFP
jgi:hypothetical protein